MTEFCHPRMILSCDPELGQAGQCAGQHLQKFLADGVRGTDSSWRYVQTQLHSENSDFFFLVTRKLSFSCCGGKHRNFRVRGVDFGGYNSDLGGTFKFKNLLKALDSSKIRKNRR